MLPAGNLSTNGSQIVDSNGNPVRIASIGWNGTDNASFAPAGLQWASYQSIIDSIKADGFNTIRLPWSDAMLNASPASGSINYSLNPSLSGLTSVQVLDSVVKYAGQVGLKIILDHHNNEGGPGGGGGDQDNGLWFDSGPGTNGTDGSGHTGTVTAAKAQADWVSLAQRYAGNQTVIGYDLMNEPSSYPGRCTWGGGGTNDLLAMYENTGNAIEAVDPGKLIIAEGAYAGNVENLLSQVPSNPVVLNEPNKVVYSVHIYPGVISGTYPDYGASAASLWNKEFGFLYTGSFKAPVLLGEMGASLDGKGPDSTGTNNVTGISNLTEEQNYASDFADYLNGKDGALGGPTFTGNQQPVSTSWWLVGDESGQMPDGIQSAWGAGNYRPEQQAMTDQLLFKPSTSTATSGSPSTPASTVTLGSGSETLALSIAEDAWKGDAQFTLSVDGQQVGGTQTATALQSAGQTQEFDVLGDFSAGSHTVSVDFLNDDYGGTSTTDRNLYVDGASINGGAIAGSSLSLMGAGSQSFSFTAPAPAGATPDTLVLGLSEDAWQGDAQFKVAINGETVAGTYTATASHAAGANQDISIAGNWGTGVKTIGVSFINDAWGGTGTTDRNLYVNHATYDGQDAAGAPAALFENGTANFTTPAGATPITVHLAEDAWNGDAQYSIAVDGKTLVQDGTATASHALGQTQSIDLQAVLSAGTHNVSVSFLNDAWGGTASTDRNLYVTGIDVNGTAVAGGTATLLSTGTDQFQIVVPKS